MKLFRANTGIPKTMPTAIILTSLPVEYAAVREHLANPVEVGHKGSVYEKGEFSSKGRTWNIAIAEIGVGNDGAASEAERAIAYFNPEVAFFVGVAGGIKDVKIGDVVVVEVAHKYESGKDEKEFYPRGDSSESSYSLINRSRAEARKAEWIDLIRGAVPSTIPKAVIGHIAAGEKVVSSTRSATCEFLRKQYSHCIAVEMEGRGFLKATHANESVKALIVRGISDFINNKGQADAAGCQEIASRHAAAFAFQVLNEYEINEQDVKDKDSPLPSHIPHPYSLLQTNDLVGRKNELALLDSWVNDTDSEISSVRLLNLVAMGGMGKSALAWKWFTDYSQNTQISWAGQMWWSFYDADNFGEKSFEKFVIHTLAYTTNRSLDEIKDIDPATRQIELLAALRDRPFLIVLDGLERLMIAYARIDAHQVSDSEIDKSLVNSQTQAEELKLPGRATQSLTGERRLRTTTDPSAGRFFKELAAICPQTRVLISTRLYPADLETDVGFPIPYVGQHQLIGLDPMDALELWRISKVRISGSGHEFIPLFESFEFLPLLIRTLGGVVASYKRAPGDFVSWRDANPDFNPISLPAAQIKSHVLWYAMSGLDEKARALLFLISAFKMPSDYSTLSAILVGKNKEFDQDDALDLVLEDLQERGLIGWDRSANRYDMHPLVRGVSFNLLLKGGKDENVFLLIRNHFESSVKSIKEGWTEVRSIDERADAIELFNALVGEKLYDKSFDLYNNHLHYELVEKLKSHQLNVELLEALFSRENSRTPLVNDEEEKARLINFMVQAYDHNGQPFRAAYVPDSVMNTFRKSSILRSIGKLYESENVARHSLLIYMKTSEEVDWRRDVGEALHLAYLGQIWGIQGKFEQASYAFDKAYDLCVKHPDTTHYYMEGFQICVRLAEYLLWNDNFTEALTWAKEAENSLNLVDAQGGHEEKLSTFSQTGWCQGKALIRLGKMGEAQKALTDSLHGSRISNDVEVQLQSLTGLADLKRRQGDLKAAREMLSHVWELAERGPFVLRHADAFNILAQIEQDEGHISEAIEAATKAYMLAWCDGPPFAYSHGLELAKQSLVALGASPPTDCPPHDATKFSPMPVVEF